MSTKSITLTRSAAAQLEDRKHSHPYLYEERETDIEKKELETNEANQWLLGPERQLSNKAAA